MSQSLDNKIIRDQSGNTDYIPSIIKLVPQQDIQSQKIVIAGSRTITDYKILIAALTAAVENKIIVNTIHTEIISGGAKGVDTLARKYAIDNGLILTEMKPQYKSNNDRGAPLRRNIDMAKYGNALVAIWDGVSTGTNHMITEMKKLGKPIYIHYVN